MDQFLHYIYIRSARFIVVFISGLLMISMFALIYYTQLPVVTLNTIKLQFAFDIPSAVKVIALWGTEGIESFLSHVWMDYIFSLAYAVFLAGSTALLTLRRTNDLREVNFVFFGLPVLAMLFNWIENGLHTLMLSTGWIPHLATLRGASLAAGCKWTLIIASLATIISLVFQEMFSASGRKGAKP
jgi:hypothetical protein